MHHYSSFFVLKSVKGMAKNMNKYHPVRRPIKVIRAATINNQYVFMNFKIGGLEL